MQKTKTILLAVLLFTSITSFAGGRGGSDNSFSQGKILISAGYGAPWLTATLFSNYSSYDGYSFKSYGPIYGKFEYAVADWVGVGLNFAMASGTANYTETSSGYVTKSTASFTTMSYLGRVNFHFIQDNEKFDAYGGIGLGYRTGGWTYKSVSTNPNYTPSNQSTATLFPFGFELTIGGKYYFTPNIGAYVELGLAKSPFQAGLCLKF